MRRAPSKRVSRKAAAAASAPLTIRHYCQGIGDCHLLRFKKENGDDFWMLIDCGVHSSVEGGSEKIDAIVADIAARTNKRLDVLVVTHEHWDHVSGFLTAASGFEGFKVGQIWTGWTEDPADPDARELDKFKGSALAITQKASGILRSQVESSLAQQAVASGLESLAGFQFGLKGEKVRKARDAGLTLGKGKLSYLEPGSKPISLPSVNGVRVYVLGPPRDRDLLKLTDRASEMYGAAGLAAWSLANVLGVSPGLDPSTGTDYFAPFDPELGSPLDQAVTIGAGTDRSSVATDIAEFVRARYVDPVASAMPATNNESKANMVDQAWRRIDNDWLLASADLAMQIDNRTNNTSLALAFEFIESGRVVLFAADAQVGSWLSWLSLEWSIDGQKVTMADLYPRTVYYKVGHHGSENATLRAKGLELMTHKDLSAFIPTNAKDALKVKWGQMPFKPILDALKERTAGRVIRADDPWIARKSSDPAATLVGGSIRAIDYEPLLWVEVDVS